MDDEFVKRPTRIEDIDINKKVILNVDAASGLLQVFDSPFIGMFERLDRDTAAQLAGFRLDNLLKSFSAETNTPMDETRRAFEQVQASGGNATDVQKDNIGSEKTGML